MNPPKKIEVFYDDREKYPVLFPEHVRYYTADCKPKLVTVVATRKRLDVGDYCLAAEPHGCVIERKGSVEELAGNFFTADRRRAKSAFLSLVRTVRTPVLLLDFSLADFYRETQNQPTPGLVVSEVLRLARSLGLVVLSLGKCRGPNIRRNLGGFLIHYMLEDMLHAQELQ